MSSLMPRASTWNCLACSYCNGNPLHLTCAICGTEREYNSPSNSIPPDNTSETCLAGGHTAVTDTVIAAPVQNTDADVQKNAAKPPPSKSSGDNESFDALALLIAQHILNNPEEPVKFDPSSKTILPNAELQIGDVDDITVISNLTIDTVWQHETAWRQRGRKTNLSHFSKVSSTVSSAFLTHNNESYPEMLAPNLQPLRELIGQCTKIGADDGAIDVLTESLVVDNATSMSQDLALFCLTELWILARKNDGNKRRIIFMDETSKILSVTFEVIIEAMRIYCDSSAVIQTRACGVLWSLSMDLNYRAAITEGGGCESILNAMLAHIDDQSLQVMALGALKVLSFDKIGKSMLRAFEASAIASNVMRKHVNNPSIQTEGCVILGNLAIDEGNQKVMPVTEEEVDAIIMAILAHESLSVHEAACFTLMTLASLSANVELIQGNSMSMDALKLAFWKHPDDVGMNILTLLKRLKFDGGKT